MYLIVDNYDSFTYNLAALVAETGRDVEVRRCDAVGLGEIAAMKPEGLIISPGPKGPADAWQSLAIVRDFKDTLPILGICLGMEILAYADGASVRRGPKPMHGKVTAIRHRSRGLFKGLPETISVTRCHSLVVPKSTLPSTYRIDAVSDDGTVMAISHKSRPLFGLQFQPEGLLSEYGSDLIQAFCRCAEEGSLKKGGASYD